MGGVSLRYTPSTLHTHFVHTYRAPCMRLIHQDAWAVGGGDAAPQVTPQGVQRHDLSRRGGGMGGIEG